MAINIEKGLAVVQKFVNNCYYSMYGSRYYTCLLYTPDAADE